ncbi:hypothetical protein AB0I52_16970 [Streptomyces sp. NPDC050423]|uniref:hypothetical protein n=1 Tax=Streptomyces sp. NPDC050423 TaxID=3155402 RepID=UPI003411FB6B
MLALAFHSGGTALNDHRFVQTAVIGSRGSDLAIILPMGGEVLRQWRLAHPTYEYWCGTLLGGCGRRLTDRLCWDKVCHFAHPPHAVCHRRANGEDSADPLFMKSAVDAWMAGRRSHGTVELRRSGWGSAADALDVDVRRGAQRWRLRFQFGWLGRDEWRAVDRKLSGGGRIRVDWVFGEEQDRIPPELLARDRYVFRIRFQTRGAERCPYLGTEHAGQTVDWIPFEDATLDDEGLRTPTLARVRSQPAQASAQSEAGRPAEDGSELGQVVARRSVQPLPAGARRAEVVHRLRAALRRAASRGTYVTWRELANSLGLDLSAYPGAELHHLLEDVERPAGPDRPVLSVLILDEDGRCLPYLSGIVSRLGLGRPASGSEYRLWREREFDRALAVYGRAPSCLPARLALTGQGPGAGRAGHRAGDEPAELHGLVAQARSILPRLRLAEQKHLRGRITAAESWLSQNRAPSGSRAPARSGDTIGKELRSAISKAEAAVEANHAKSKRKHKPRGVKDGAAETLTPPMRKKRPWAAPDAVLQRTLVLVAQRGSTVTWEQLVEGVAAESSATVDRGRTLAALERGIASGDPLLSALVTMPDGSPVPYARDVLRSVGLAVPDTDKALEIIWKSEQQRAHAAYALPRRPAPPRLVPMVRGSVKGQGG